MHFVADAVKQTEKNGQQKNQTRFAPPQLNWNCEQGGSGQNTVGKGMQELVKGKYLGHDKGVAGQGGKKEEQGHDADDRQEAEQTHLSQQTELRQAADALGGAVRQDTVFLFGAEQH
jgi:hypothetical protein